MGIYDYEREANKGDLQGNAVTTDPGTASDSGWSAVNGVPSERQSYVDSGAIPATSDTPSNSGFVPNASGGGTVYGAANPAKNYGFTGNPPPETTTTAKTGTAQSTNPNRRAAAAVVAAEKPYSTAQTTQTIYPKGMQFPNFVKPAWDEQEIKKKTRQMAAPGLSSLNMKVQSAMSRYYENPNVRRMVLRDTMAGYGVGLAQVMGAAQQGAQAQYSQEYSRDYGSAMDAYNMAMGKLQAQSGKTTTTQSFKTKKEYDKYLNETKSDIGI